MDSLGFIYYAVSYSTALPAIAVVAAAYAASRERILRSCLPFLASAALQLAAVAVLRYQDAVIVPAGARITARHLYFLVESTLVLTLPLISHAVSRPRNALRDSVFLGIFVLCIALILSPFFAGTAEGALSPRWGFYVYRAVFFSTLAYSAAVLGVGFFKAGPGIVRAVAAFSFLAAILLAWEMLHCELFPVLHTAIIPLSPACVLALNVFLIFRVFRRGLVRPAAAPGRSEAPADSNTAAPAAPGSITASAVPAAALSAISTREMEIASLLAAGRRTREICNELFISESTVKTHIKSIYRKLRVRNRVQLVNLMQGRGGK